MFYAHIIKASFELSVRETGAATASSLSTRRSRRSARRRALPLASPVVPVVPVAPATATVSPVVPVVPVAPATATISVVEEDADLPPAKRVRLSSPPPATRVSVPATFIWCASFFNDIIAHEISKTLAFFERKKTTVSLSAFGSSLSADVPSTLAVRELVGRFEQELSALGVGFNTTTSTTKRKRSFEED